MVEVSVKGNTLFNSIVGKTRQFSKFLNNTDILSLIGIIIPLIALVIVGYVLYQMTSSFVSHIEILEKTFSLSPILERTVLYFFNAETGIRGYLLTGNASYLEPYNTSLKNIDTQIQTLLEMTSHNQSQLNLIKDTVIPLLDKQLIIQQDLLKLNGGGETNARSSTINATLISESKTNLDKIRTIIQTFQDNQNDFLKNKTDAIELQSNSFLDKISILILAIFLIAGITIFSINRAIKNRNVEIKRKLESEILKNTQDLKESNSKLKTLNEELSKHDQLQKDFINIAAHELRTPCQAITGYSELAMSDEFYKAVDLKNGRFIESIYKNASRLQELIERILDVVKIESNNLRLNIEKADIVEEIRNTAKEFTEEREITDGKRFVKRSHINKNSDGKIDIIIDLDVPPYPIIVNIDKIRMRQVMSHLLNNAIKVTQDNFKDMRPESVITISIGIQNYGDADTEDKRVRDRNSNKFVYVRVTDSGKGIPKEFLPNLFSKFFSFSEKGIGLGLFISKGIIEMHSGKISAHNSHLEGRGAVIEFVIPCYPIESSRQKMNS